MLHYICPNKQTKYIMKIKVIAKLVKWGNNSQDVLTMVNEHFEYASNNYNTVASISNCIRTIY